MPEDVSTGETSVHPNPPAQTSLTIDPYKVASDIAAYESRVRDLISQKDRIRAEHERAVAERVTLQQELDSIKAERENVLQGATKATEAALNRAKDLESKLTQESARRLKLEKLLSNPELFPYAEFIPETNDDAALQAAIDKFKAVRDQDLARLQPPVTQTPPIYPSNQVPPANPARPAASGTNVPDISAQIQEMLRTAKLEAEQKGDRSIWFMAMDKARHMLANQPK